jgi:hypothetical protein
VPKKEGCYTGISLFKNYLNLFNMKMKILLCSITILVNFHMILSLSAYDCAHPRKNVTRVSLTTIKGCKATNNNVEEKSEHVQILQVSSSIRVQVKQCKIVILRQIFM